MAALQLDNLNARIDQLEVDSAVTKSELFDVLQYSTVFYLFKTISD